MSSCRQQYRTVTAVLTGMVTPSSWSPVTTNHSGQMVHTRPLSMYGNDDCLKMLMGLQPQ